MSERHVCIEIAGFVMHTFVLFFISVYLFCPVSCQTGQIPVL